MIKNIKLFILLIAIFALSALNAKAEDKDEVKKFPYIDGKAIFELHSDRITSSGNDVPKGNSFVNFEPYFNMHINNNWTVQTNLKAYPYIKRSNNLDNPERYRTILADDRKIHVDDENLVVEQIKGQFENEDMKFFFGKFNPSFGTAWRQEKRIGVFTTDYTKDYQLREKIGLGGAALLENCEITVNSFFNDNTGLSNSALARRGRDRYDDFAGNTSTLSSYSVTVEGQKLIGIENLFYNLGYRRLAVNKNADNDDEKGYVGGLEYMIPLGSNAAIIPFIEVAKIDNFSGFKNRNAKYITSAIIFRYSSWNASVAKIDRDINYRGYYDYNDRQLQYSVGYKFTKNLALDVTRMNLKETGQKATMLGALVSYVYEF